MLTAKQAYKVLSKDNPASIVKSCLDFGSFFAFSLAPITIGDKVYYTGTTMDAVDKKTGMIFEYDITSDIDAYENAKEVSIDTVFNRKL